MPLPDEYKAPLVSSVGQVKGRETGSDLWF